MPEELRKRFHQQLSEIDSIVVRLFALVIESVSAATEALLSGDRETALELAQRDELIDRLNLDIEEIVQRQLIKQAPVAGDMRYLLTVLRVVPELERSGDLAEHIAQRAAHGLTADLTPTIRGIIQDMGEACVDIWRAAAEAWADRDGEAAARLEDQDDHLDELHERFTAELLQGAAPLHAALQLSLVGRFYERLGDHAVHVTARVRYLALGH